MVEPGPKLAGLLFLLLMDLSFVLYIYLFAIRQTPQRQDAWIRGFLIWFFIDVFLVSTASVLLTHLLLPMVAMREIHKIKARLTETIIQYYAKLDQNGESLVQRSEKFNAASYLFVSYRVAQLFPDLKESKIIQQFSTPWPHQSYQHVRETKRNYSSKFSSITRSGSVVIISLLAGFLRIPQSVQV